METSRDHMLASIRASLEQSRATLADMAARTPHAPPPFVHPPQDDLPAQFAAELTKLEGYPHRCADDSQALDAIRIILQRHQAASVVAWDRAQIGLPGSTRYWPSLARMCSTAILSAPSAPHDCGRLSRRRSASRAPTPALPRAARCVLRSGSGRGRLASLIAPVHIAVLRRAQIVRGLGAALALLQEQHGRDLFVDSSNLTLISGPSRTGDIELTLTLGVHGPREIHVVLID